MQLLGLFIHSAGNDQPAMYRDMPITIGFSLIIGMGIFMACCMKKYDWGIKGDQNLQIGTICSVFTVLCLVLSTKLFPWDSIKDMSAGVSRILSVVQFPWRYLAIGTVTCMIVTVIGVKLLRDCKGVVCGRMAAGTMIVFTLLSTGHFYMEFGNSVPPVYAYGRVGHHDGLAGGEYLLGDMHTHMVDTLWRKVVTDENFITIDKYEYTDGVTTFWCKNVSDEDKTVEIPLIAYANYHAFAVDQGIELEIRNGERGFANIVIPSSYEGTVQVSYQIPVLWRLSYIISAFAFAGIAVSIFYNRRHMIIS